MSRLTIFALVFASACSLVGKGDGSSTSEDGAGGADGSGADGTEDTQVGPPEEDFAVVSTITGQVTVELYGEDEIGERYSIPWESSGYTSWPFGPIFVAAYELSGDGQAGRYAGTAVIRRPEMGTSTYEMTVKMREEKDVYVYAAVDLLGDGVVGTEDPRGVWRDAIPMTNDIVVSDINMTVLAQAADEVVCEGGSTVEIDGPAYVTTDYWGGNIAVMLMDRDGNGPYHVASAAEVGAGEGATTSYTLEVCPNYGEMVLVSCWDSNMNGIFDGGDRWGVYSATGDRDSNPVNVGDRNMSNYPVWMPLGDRPGVDLMPFVTMQGTLHLESGEPLSSLDTGTNLYVVALKYRPSGDLVVTDPAVHYDIQTFSWSDISTGTTAVDWQLLVPSDTIIYLWAFADTNGDGVVNGPGEPIGAYNAHDHGRTPSGQTGFGGIDIALTNAGG